MPVPSLITDLTTVAATNSPLGSESPATADDYFRAHASFIAQMRAVIGGAVDTSIPSSALGVGQTWQAVAGKALSTTYTNTSGRPIDVTVITNPVAGGTSLTLLVGGIAAGYAQTSESGVAISVSATVPAGATYRANASASPTLNSWQELRA
jgi:hypothetical protein